MRRMLLVSCFCLAAASASAAPQAVNAELIRLHDDLRLSEAQETAWRDYTTAIAPDPQAEARHRSTAEMLPQLSTPRRLALIQATLDADAGDFRRHTAAVIRFYEQLTPAQQSTFDRDTAPGAPSGQTPSS